MVAIRLSRTGAKKRPSYRVVVIDSRRARDSRNIEIVGHYNPRPDPIEVVLKRDRIDYWMGVGAQPSKTVTRLMKHFDERSSQVAEEPEEAAESAAAEEQAADAKAAAAPAEEEATATAESQQPGQPTGDAADEDDSDVEIPEDVG